jgi:hypothetical protein
MVPQFGEPRAKPTLRQQRRQGQPWRRPQPDDEFTGRQAASTPRASGQNEHWGPPMASVSTMRVQLFRLKPNRISLIRNKKMGAADAVACQPSAPFPRSALLVFSVVATPLVITQDNEGRLNFSNLTVTTPHARQLTDPFRPTWRTPLVNHSPTSGIGNAESRRASHGRKSLRSATLSDWWPPK